MGLPWESNEMLNMSLEKNNKFILKTMPIALKVANRFDFVVFDVFG
jgi:hypothetical protein